MPQEVGLQVQRVKVHSLCGAAILADIRDLRHFEAFTRFTLIRHAIFDWAKEFVQPDVGFVRQVLIAKQQSGALIKQFPDGAEFVFGFDLGQLDIMDFDAEMLGQWGGFRALVCVRHVWVLKDGCVW